MRSGLDAEGLTIALRRAGSIVIFGVLPAALVVAVMARTFHQNFVYDFHGGLYAGGRAVLNGHDPYRVAFLDHAAALVRAGESSPRIFAVPVYLAPSLVAAIPVAALPFHLAGIVYTVLSIAGMIVGLRLLGVTDWRCYGIPFLSWPLIHSLRLGQVNELLVFGTGVVWYWRRRLVAPAVALASLVAVNLFLWPLGFFMLLTRRVHVAVLAVALFIAAALTSWAVIGFGTLGSYPRMIGDLSSIEAGIGVSYVSGGIAIGLSRPVSQAIAIAITLGVLGLVFVFARRPGGEARAFGLAVMAGLASSPVVWPHYFVLVFVAIALVSPRLSVLWLIPLIAYLAPVAQTTGNLWQIIPYIAIELITIAALCFWPTHDETAMPAQQPRQPRRPGLLGAR
jgi:Glycosyltransferase family 87